jgi:hypothetical protein
MLLEKYCRARENVAGLISLENTSIVTPLQRFLADPKNSLTRELFDPLFDLLKGREDIDSFEKIASEKTEEIFPHVFRGGYEKWAVLALVRLLEADRAFQVEVRNLNPGERAKSAANAPMEQVPVPQASISFPFNQSRYAIFAVPDFVIHSSRMDRYVGIRSEFKEALYHAWNASPEREWYPIDTDLLILLESGLTLIYVSEQADSIALVADVAKFCRPDLVLWCVGSRSLTQKAVLEGMARVERLVRPLKGSFVVANDTWPEPGRLQELDLQSQADGETARVRFLTVGYDESNLRPVADALLGATGSAPTT